MQLWIKIHTAMDIY